MSDFDASLAQAITLNQEAVALGSKLQQLRSQRDECIIVALQDTQSAEKCLSLRPLATSYYQKWLVALLAIRYFDPEIDTIELLREIRFLFWKEGEGRWGYEKGTESSFGNAYRQRASFRDLLLERFGYKNDRPWDWYEFLYAQAEIATQLYDNKRKRLIERMDMSALDSLHKTGHWCDKQLCGRFQEFLRLHNIRTPSELHRALGRRPRQWELEVLKQEE